MLAIIRGAGDIASAGLRTPAQMRRFRHYDGGRTSRRSVAQSPSAKLFIQGKPRWKASLACVLKASMMRCDEHSKGRSRARRPEMLMHLA